MPRVLPLSLAVCFSLAFNAIALENFFRGGSSGFHAENGTLESLQASLLVLGCLLYSLSFFLGGGRLSAAVDESWISRGSALLCLSFFVREVDLETLSLPALLVIPWVGNGRTLTLCLLWGFFIFAMARSRASTTSLVQASIEQRLMHCFALAAVLLCSGAVFDRGLVGGDSARFFEELLETNAYMMLMLPLYWLLPTLRQSESQSAA